MKDLGAKWKAESLEQSILSLLREVVEFTVHIKLLKSGQMLRLLHSGNVRRTWNDSRGIFLSCQIKEWLILKLEFHQTKNALLKSQNCLTKDQCQLSPLLGTCCRKYNTIFPFTTPVNRIIVQYVTSALVLSSRYKVQPKKAGRPQLDRPAGVDRLRWEVDVSVGQVGVQQPKTTSMYQTN